MVKVTVESKWFFCFDSHMKMEAAAVMVEATRFYCFARHMEMKMVVEEVVGVVMRAEMFEEGLLNRTQAEVEVTQLLVKSVKLMWPQKHQQLRNYPSQSYCQDRQCRCRSPPLHKTLYVK